MDPYVIEFSKKCSNIVLNNFKKVDPKGFNSLMLDYLPSLKKGEFVGVLKSSSKDSDTYRIFFDTPDFIKKAYGEYYLTYKVNYVNNTIVIESLCYYFDIASKLIVETEHYDNEIIVPKDKFVQLSFKFDVIKALTGDTKEHDILCDFYRLDDVDARVPNKKLIEQQYKEKCDNAFDLCINKLHELLKSRGFSEFVFYINNFSNLLYYQQNPPVIPTSFQPNYPAYIISLVAALFFHDVTYSTFFLVVAVSMIILCFIHFIGYRTGVVVPDYKRKLDFYNFVRYDQSVSLIYREYTSLLASYSREKVELLQTKEEQCINNVSYINKVWKDLNDLVANLYIYEVLESSKELKLTPELEELLNVYPRFFDYFKKSNNNSSNNKKDSLDNKKDSSDNKNGFVNKKSKTKKSIVNKIAPDSSGMRGYVIDYINENEFKKLERALKKYNMLAYKKLNFEYYPAMRNGNFVGEITNQNIKAGTETYELKLPSDSMFSQVHGDVKLVYTVYVKEQTIMLNTITPSDILLDGHKSELTTYKGIMISKQNASKDMFKIDLLKMLQNNK